MIALFISAIDFDGYEMLVSSAYLVTDVLCNAQGISFMDIKIVEDKDTILVVRRNSCLLFFMHVHLLHSIAYDQVSKFKPIQLLTPNSIMTKRLNEASQ